MKVALSLVILLLNAALVLGDSSASLVVFLPEGARAVLSSQDVSRQLDSGVPLVLEAGEVDLTVSHEDYEPYVRHLFLEPGRELILLPWLKLSTVYRQAQRSSLLQQREQVQAQRDEVALGALGVGALALAGWAAVGGLEWTLANKKTALADRQVAYRAASSDQAPQEWSSIEALQAEISTLRFYETYALGSSGGLSLGALALWLLGPDTEGLEEGLRGLK